MAAVKTIKIDKLQPDTNNANAHTQRGMGVLEKSLQNYGAGRSILIDRNNRIIAGNATTEIAYSIGLEDVLVVETRGEQLVAVKRLDLDLDDPKARQLALSDNRVGELNLSWDVEQLVADFNLLSSTNLWNEKELQLIQDGADLLQFEAIAAGEAVAKEEISTSTATETTKDESGLLPFHVLLSQQQRERLFTAISEAKSKHGLETTAEALDVIVQEYLG
ncbi:hypothetical protein [Chroococcidiopsis sp.]|uniref:hypothetical protein n=1 Tax=Chroococcidiopsis sp. TaxID=3088168 RepID=UPI003F329B67